jgi:hypothetical protein
MTYYCKFVFVMSMNCPFRNQRPIKSILIFYYRPHACPTYDSMLTVVPVAWNEAVEPFEPRLPAFLVGERGECAIVEAYRLEGTGDNREQADVMALPIDVY